MPFTAACVVVTCFLNKCLARIRFRQSLCYADRSRCIFDVDDRTFVVGLDLDRRVRRRRSRTTDEKWQFKIEALHFARDMNHLVERWCDET